MVRRAGSADLPLHGGRVPAWLPVLIAEERARPHDYGGRSVPGREPPPEAAGQAAERRS